MNNGDKACPFCGEAVLAVAIKCRHCASDLSGAAGQGPAAVIVSGADTPGLLLVLLPVLGLGILFLAWSKISGEFMFIEARQVIDTSNTFFFLALGCVILGSAVLVGVDAARLGFGQNKMHVSSAARSGPGVWVAGQLLIWIVAYPWYMAARRQLGVGIPNRTGLAVFLALLFSGAAGVVGFVIEERVGQVRQQAATLRSSVEQARAVFSHAATLPGGAGPTLPAAPSNPDPVPAQTDLGEWEKPWSVVKSAGKIRCAKIFDNYQLQAICMDNEKSGYTKMQGDFGLPGGVARQAKVKCAKIFDVFQMQAICMENEKKGYAQMHAE